ncbi:protein translocase subunit SecF [Dermatophilus congolensis]|uniref:protein translocase subunit SecF n=1 Tax=Dermatophilus congolensis TaxID=1863 RepID=UPI001AB0138E|nr:protein translocase subunit SecF [Dermatophilus congolensis]MBO3142779.1 protein translocase subunit SecF [Dermatophilus congolensis]MBO3151772.1 protein translocase subunit SecF [Dermatophilus congolensis]MBO3161225.1 protein translocase subunit SecF [Dermatophilus congolensis]MBO3163054.1 protein translocase subunit SecF [Dermatophilus congolensis]MBO3176607.1 protein translocase subunit SecF [Dermatophilus congolensis]
MSKLTDFGNDLYTGQRSIPFVGKLKLWLSISAVLMVIVALGVGLRGLNPGIEFTGGSDFRVSGVADTQSYDTKAQAAVKGASGVDVASSTVISGNTVRIQTERMKDDSVRQVSAALAKTFGVPVENVNSSVVGPSWGESVSKQAIQALVVFLVIVSLVLALYFRTWKMSLAALIALAHDMIVTVGIYALAGFEITPASTIGFLTVLGYSIYDTVVVFDKVRENTAEAAKTGRQTYSEAANLAVNQTLIRSINTTIVALLPILAVLVMGFTVIGPGTLLDLSLSLFVGVSVGVYSSICIATPLLAHWREKEPAMRELSVRARKRREQLEQQGVRVDARGYIEQSVMADQSAGDASAPEPVPAHTGAFERPVPLASDQEVGPQTMTGRLIHPSMLQEDSKGKKKKRFGRKSR